MPIFLINRKEESETRRADASTFNDACKSLNLNPADCEGDMKLAGGSWERIITEKGEAMTEKDFRAPEPLSEEAREELTAGRDVMINDATKPRKTRADKGQSRKPVEPPKRRSRARSNITVEDIGNIYFDGKTYWKLTGFQPEPQVVMCELGTPLNQVAGGISKFAGFVRLVPEKRR